MKITDVKVIPVNKFLFVKVFTDEGITGLGESGDWGFLLSSGEVIESFREYLIGKNPMDIEHHWEYMYRCFHFRGAAVMGALSAIDIALYDIKGKALGVPVYQLLGGKCRDKIRVYSHVSGKRGATGQMSGGKGKGISRCRPPVSLPGRAPLRAVL